MARGDHIITPMVAYSHHGIDLGGGTVVHWTSAAGQTKRDGIIRCKHHAEIRQTALADFSGGAPVWVREYAHCFDSETVVARALALVGRRGYHLADNNCEHFACWCKTGRHHSQQVKDCLAVVVGSTGLITTVSGGLGVVSAAGPTPGLDARGALEGLAAVGRVVGCGPAVGLVGLLGAPAVAAVLAVQAALSDDDCRVEEEREARAAGRAAGVGGAVAGTGAAVGAVAAAGAPGLSAAGIASGLAVLGGGYVGLGLAAMLAFPAAVTLGASWLAYRLCSGSHHPPTPSRQPTLTQPTDRSTDSHEDAALDSPIPRRTS
jgi:hypothetical protein